MPKFSYFPVEDEDMDLTYSTTEKIRSKKPREKSNHLGKSQNKKNWHNKWD